jgi:hypothetical protein
VAVDSTWSDVRPADLGPPPRWAKRIGLCLLLLVVIAGALGLFGVHSHTNHVNSNGYQLTVTYPQTARAGLDVPFRVGVHHAGGFDGPLTIEISNDYFRMFETQGFFPNADSMTNDGTFVSFTFTKPKSANFLFEYDAYIQPSAQLGKSATIRILVHGAMVATTSLHTWLVP